MHRREFEYRVRGRRVRLTSSDDLVAVRFREPAYYSIRAQVARDVPLGPFEQRFEVPDEKFTIFRTPLTGDADAAQISAQLASTDAVSRTAPVFRVRDTSAVPTDRLIIGVVDSQSSAVRRKLLDSGLEVLEEGHASIVVRLPETADPLEMCRVIDTWAGVRYVEPDFVTVRQPPLLETGLPLGPLNAPPRSLSYTGYPMQLIGVDRVRELLRGDPSIIVAILDDGADLSHGALSPAVAGTFDALRNTPLTGPNSWDPHGTACAGLVAATRQTGIDDFEGVAAGCSLLLVRIAQSAYSGGPWVTTNTCVSRGIDWACDNGADVLCNSWGGGPPSNAVIEAIERARTMGRRNKGCVVVAAAGNASNSVEYPANLNGVLAVAGTNQWDEYKTISSSDGETWWGSNFGPEVDLAAPSVRLRTTDLRGSFGFSPNDYTEIFNGTSAATPLVAGAAALVLSGNSALTEAEVRQLLVDNADKVGALPYVNRRNDRYGSGRLNVLAAVRAALGTGPGVNQGGSEPVVTPPGRVPSGNGTGSPGTSPGIYSPVPPGEVHLGGDSLDDEPEPPGTRDGDPPANEIWLGFAEEVKEEDDTSVFSSVGPYADSVTCTEACDAG